MKPQTEDANNIVKTTIRMPRKLWNRVRTRAIEEQRDAQDLVVAALKEYMSKKGGQQ